MPDLSLADPNGPAHAATLDARAPQTPDLRPGATDGLSPDAVGGLDRARQNGLTALYGSEWEAAGARLYAAFAQDGPAAYRQLERDPGAYGSVVSADVRAANVAGGLWAREHVLAGARGETLPASYRSAESNTRTDAPPPADRALAVDPPQRLRPGDHLEFGDTITRAVPAGARSRDNGGPAAPAGSPVLPLGVSVRGYVAVDRVGTVDGRQAAEITVSAFSTASTNALGRVDNAFVGGRLVEVLRDGSDGRSIPFTLRPDPRGVVIPDSPGGSREMGTATLTAPAGRVYRAEFVVATTLPDRGARLAPQTYRPDETFTPVGSGAR